MSEEEKVAEREEGIKQAKIEITKSLLAILDITTTLKKTGFPLEEIEKRKDMNK